jgi:hypothetical protein
VASTEVSWILEQRITALYSESVLYSVYNGIYAKIECVLDQFTTPSMLNPNKDFC